MHQSLMDAFTDELVLIKVAKNPKPKKNDDITGSQVAGATAGVLGTGAAQSGLGAVVMPTLKDEALKGESKEDLLKRVERLKGEMDVKKVDVAPDLGELMGPHMSQRKPGASGKGVGAPDIGAHFGGGRRYIGVGKGTKDSIIAHELGHAKTDVMLGKRFRGAGRALNLASRNLSRLGSLPTTIIAAGQDDPTWTAGATQAAMAVPMLADEALASGHAVRTLIKRHGVGRGLRKSLPLAPAFGTYALMAGAPAAITAGRKLYRKFKGTATAAPAEAAA